MVANVLVYSFNLIRKKPKIVLPELLYWIVLALVIVLFYLVSINMTNFFIPAKSSLVYTNLISNLIPFSIFMILIFVVAVYIQGIYPDIVRQAFTKKDIVLTESFKTARKRFCSLLWTNILLILLIMLIIGGAAALLIGMLGILKIVSPLIGIMLVLGFIVATIFGIPGIYMLSTVVVLENLSGIAAIKRSFALSRGRVLSIWGVIFLIGIFSMGLYVLILVPVIGLLLYVPISLFVATWSKNASTSYYFLREKKMKPKL